MNTIKPGGVIMQDLKQYEDNAITCDGNETNDPPHIKIFYAANGLQSVIDRLDVLCSMIEAGESVPSPKDPRTSPTSHPSLACVIQETPLQLESMARDMHDRIEKVERLLFHNV